MVNFCSAFAPPNGVLKEMCSFEPETCTEPMEIQRRVQCNVCICIAVVLVDH